MKASITSVVQVEFPRGQSWPRYGIESKRESLSKVFMRADRSAHVQDLSSRRRSNSFTVGRPRFESNPPGRLKEQILHGNHIVNGIRSLPCFLEASLILFMNKAKFEKQLRQSNCSRWVGHATNRFAPDSRSTHVIDSL